MSTDHLPFDDAMKRALDHDPVPELSPDFADRVVAATQGRPKPLPQTRTAPARCWRTGRRLAIGVVAAGALATTAAATGVLEELGIDLPSPQQVWSAVTGRESAPEPTSGEVREPAEPAVPASEMETRIEIEGPIDTPEELEEAFRRVDEVRTDRRENRRERVDNRIDRAIERRREQGLRAPTPEGEERLRERLDRFRQRSDERREERTSENREELRQRLEEEGEVTRRDIIESTIDADPVARRLQRLRELPPEERREVLRQWRERRQERRERRRERLQVPQGEQVSAPVDAQETPLEPSDENEPPREL